MATYDKFGNLIPDDLPGGVMAAQEQAAQNQRELRRVAPADGSGGPTALSRWMAQLAAQRGARFAALPADDPRQGLPTTPAAPAVPAWAMPAAQRIAAESGSGIQKPWIAPNTNGAPDTPVEAAMRAAIRAANPPIVPPAVPFSPETARDSINAFLPQNQDPNARIRSIVDNPTLMKDINFANPGIISSRDSRGNLSLTNLGPDGKPLPASGVAAVSGRQPSINVPLSVGDGSFASGMGNFFAAGAGLKVLANTQAGKIAAAKAEADAVAKGANAARDLGAAQVSTAHLELANAYLRKNPGDYQGASLVASGRSGAGASVPLGIQPLDMSKGVANVFDPATKTITATRIQQPPITEANIAASMKAQNLTRAQAIARYKAEGHDVSGLR